MNVTDLDHYYYIHMSEPEKAAYSALCDGLRRRDSEIEIGITSHEAIKKIGRAVLYENPEFFYLGHEYTIRSSPLRSTVSVSFRYIYSDAECRRMLSEIDKIVDGFSYMNDEHYIRNVHNHFVKSIKYDSNDDRADAVTHDENHSMVGPFLRGKAVCEGIAKAYAYAMRKRGIGCTVLCGKYLDERTNKWEGHSWNIVRLAGQNYHVDVTADCTLSDTPDGKLPKPRFDYFCVSDNMMLSTHSFPVRFECNDDSENHFIKKGCAFKDISSLRSYVRSLSKNTLFFGLMYVGIPYEQVEAAVCSELGQKFGSCHVAMLKNTNMSIVYFKIEPKAK